VKKTQRDVGACSKKKAKNQAGKSRGNGGREPPSLQGDKDAPAESRGPRVPVHLKPPNRPKNATKEPKGKAARRRDPLNLKQSQPSRPKGGLPNRKRAKKPRQVLKSQTVMRSKTYPRRFWSREGENEDRTPVYIKPIAGRGDEQRPFSGSSANGEIKR